MDASSSRDRRLFRAMSFTNAACCTSRISAAWPCVRTHTPIHPSKAARRRSAADRTGGPAPRASAAPEPVAAPITG